MLTILRHPKRTKIKKVIALDDKNQYTIDEKDSYEDYIDNLQLLLDKYVKNNADIDYVRDCVEERKLPRGKNRKIVGDIINSLDDFYTKTIKSKNIIKYPYSERPDFINVYGSAGSGKSYWTCCFAKQYKEKYPDNQIYLITTNVEDDSNYKGIGMKKLVVSRDIIDGLEFDESSFEDSLVIFDDIEHPDVGIYTWIRSLRDLLFLKARKHNTDIVNVIHRALDNHNTKIPNDECNGCVVFPRHSWTQAKKVLTTHFNLTNCQLRKINSLKKNNRHVYISRIYPKYAIASNDIILLD